MASAQTPQKMLRDANVGVLNAGKMIKWGIFMPVPRSADVSSTLLQSD